MASGVAGARLHAPRQALRILIHPRNSRTEQVGVAGRVEYLSDDGGNPDGDPWTLTTATATLDVRPAPNLIIRFDGRMELSSQDVFSTLPDGLDGMPVPSPDATDQWFMGALGVVVTTAP